MGAAGLAIIPRYTMLAASILFIFAAASVLGWRLAEPGDRWRRPWQVAAVLVVLLYIVWLPNQYDLLSKVDRDLSNQSLVERDLEALVDDGAFTHRPPSRSPGSFGSGAQRSKTACRSRCRTTAPSRASPSGWTSAPPTWSAIAAADGAAPTTGFFLAPAREFTVENFILDPGDAGRTASEAATRLRTGRREPLLEALRELRPAARRVATAPLEDRTGDRWTEVPSRRLSRAARR